MNIKADNVRYYFHSVQRDTLDMRRHGNRAIKLAEIRDRLMAYPDETFQRVVRLLGSLDKDGGDTSRDQDDELRYHERQLMSGIHTSTPQS